MFRDVLNRRVLAAAARAARTLPTPFYLFDPAEVRRQVRAWRRTASAGSAAIFYPYKCNRAPEVLELFARERLGAEVTSPADFQRAARLGISGARIVIQGPAKEVPLIDAGLAAGSLFVVDGVEDAHAVLSRARALSRLPRYLLRLLPTHASGEQRDFGLPARRLVTLTRELTRRGGPPPEGLAFHLGTGIASGAPYRRALREAGAVGRDLARLGIRIRRLDVGGGFAARSESRLDPWAGPRRAAGGSALLPILVRQAQALFGKGVEVLVEPGRALVSGAFHLVARVVRVKIQGPRATVFLDASRLSHAFFVAHGRHPIAAVSRRGGARRRVALAGPLGVGLDLFAPSLMLGPIEPGDLLVIGSVGAYNLNAANTWAGGPLTISTLI